MWRKGGRWWAAMGGVVEGGARGMILCLSPASASALCLSYYRNLFFRKPGRRECFQSGEYQELTRQTRYSCPQEKTDNPEHLSQSLPFVYLSLLVAAIKDVWRKGHEIRKMGQN